MTDPSPKPSLSTVFTSIFAEIEVEATTLFAEYDRRFGKDCFTKELGFIATLHALAKAKDALPVCQEIQARVLGVDRMEDFDDRYRTSLRALAAGETSSDAAGTVPVDLRDYVWTALRHATEDRSRGLVADTSRVEKLLEFLRQALEEPALAEYRAGSGALPLLGAAQPGSSETPAAEQPPGPITPAVPSLLGPTSEVGAYELREEIGRGGMGAVYRAEHKLLKATFAVKVIRDLPPPGPGRDRAVKRFVQEARLHCKLDHPNIVRLREAFEEGSELFLVMEYVEGKTLRRVLEEEGRLPPGKIVDLGIAIAEALRSALDHEIIHRDLKPDNILVTPDGRFKLADFGLARLIRSGGTRLTEGDSVIGTPAYMSPEQLRGEDLDHRSDVYGLGALLYHAASGAPPFVAEDVETLIHHALKDPPIRLSHLVDGFPTEVDDLVQTCLQKQKERRFETYSKLLGSLHRCREDLARLGGAGSPRPGRSRRRAWAVLAAGLLLISIAAAVGVWHLNPNRKRPAGPELSSEPPVNLPPSPGSSPMLQAPPVAEDLAGRFHPNRGPEPPAPPPNVVPEVRPEQLGKKIASYTLSEAEMDLIRELLGLFSTHRTGLLARSYEPLRADLASFESRFPEGSVYLSLHSAAARDMIERAERTVRAGIQEIGRRKVKIALPLSDGSTVAGIPDRVEAASLVLTDDLGAAVEVPFARLASQVFLMDGAPPDAQLAYLALSVDALKALGEASRFMELKDEFTPWLPIVVRLVRLETKHRLLEAAIDAREVLAANPRIENPQAALPRYRAAVSSTDEFAAREAQVLKIYPFLEPEFADVRREREALELLLAGDRAGVLAKHSGTAAHPAAADLVLAELESDLKSGHDELIAGRGWYDWDWKLWPPIPDLRERLKHASTDPESRGTILSDPAGTRSLVMKDGGSRAPEGLVFRVRFAALDTESERSHWGFLLIGEGGRQVLLRVTTEGLEIRRVALAPGARDEVLASAPLPNAAGERAFTLLPAGTHLHIFVDRRLVLSVARAEADIPKELAFTVTRGKLTIASLRARKAPAAAKDPM